MHKEFISEKEEKLRILKEDGFNVPYFQVLRSTDLRYMGGGHTK